MSLKSTCRALWLGVSCVGLFALPLAKSFAQEPTIVAAEHDNIIVRVYFPDLLTAQRIAASFEPLQADYTKGYLLLALTDSELEDFRFRFDGLDLQLRIDAERTRAATRSAILAQSRIGAAAGVRSIPGFPCYRTVEETYSAAQDIADEHPSLAEWLDIGDSWEKSAGRGGYDVMLLRLTNAAIPGPKPRLLINSGLHAREYAPVELNMRFAEYLMQNYETDPDVTWILDYHELHLLLISNPDGRKQAETGLLWRKNTNQAYCGVADNLRGADLNRNFEFQWNCCGGSSADPCSSTFRGAGPASEPETQALQNYLRALFRDRRGEQINDAAPVDSVGLYIDLHSSGRLLLWPWGSSFGPAPNAAQLRTLGRKLAFFNGYAPLQASGLALTDGASDDAAYGDLGIASYTFELGGAFFESCSSFENTVLPDNLAALLYAAKVALAPYRLPAGPDITALNLTPGAGNSGSLTAVVDDGRYNHSNGSEPSELISTAHYSIDVPIWLPHAESFAMSAVDGAFDSVGEAVQATIDFSALASGRHTVYVRGQDSSANWGPVSAVFVDVDHAGTPIFFDDFESDTGWQLDPDATDTASSGHWQRARALATDYRGAKQLAGLNGDFVLVTGPQGDSASIDDVDRGVTTIRSPLIALPSERSVELRFSYYLAYYNASISDGLRVSVITDTGAQVIFEQTAVAHAETDAVWRDFATRLDVFAGQEIYLLFEAFDRTHPSIVEAAIGDVAISVF